MKKLLMIVASGAMLFSACYKEPQPAQPIDVLTRHKWKIDSHVLTSTGEAPDCRIPTEVEFDRDSTGYFIYETPCNPTDPQKRIFRWQATYENRNLVLIFQDGSPYARHIVSLQYYDDEMLRMRSELYDGYYVDGYFKANGGK